MSHASNVCGTIQDAASVGELAHKHGILFMLDASQSAGIIDIDMKRDNIDYLAAPGHKALYGPMGTGILCINSDFPLKPFMYGGTGSYSHMFSQPEEIPDRFECGTLNFPGICGLRSGVQFISALGISNILRHELKLTDYLISAMSDMKDYNIIGKNTTDNRVGVVSFTHKKHSASYIADYLNSSYGIATRAMYHCAYPSHVSLGTSDGGTVRVSFGLFNTLGQIKTLLYAMEHI